eukprot:scaffold1327_cov65-Cyclotella_meneghiniana.AAC.12
MNNAAAIPSLHQWLAENDMDSLDTVLVLFVFVFILLSHSPLAVVAISLSYLIGNKHGKRETYYTGRQAGYREGIKEGLKQGGRHANEVKMPLILLLTAAIFLVGLFVGVKVAGVFYRR